MASNVKITSRGIQKVLRNYNSRQALAEFIWNGFDANATTIEVNYSANQLGRLDFIELIDNGYGIDFEKLTSKFNPFYESEKAIEISTPKHTSTMHGKNGVGRLTFFTFAYSAEWLTTFSKNEILKSGKILINVDGLNTYQADLLDNQAQKNTGTRVIFKNVFISIEELENSILPYLFTEFCWFLELKKNKSYTILINGEPLDYNLNVIDYEKGNKIEYDENKTVFEFKYIQWNESLHREYSKYYFLNSEVYKDYTTLNNKGDQFYHSIYIQSDFFNDFDFKVSEEDTQIKLFGKAKSSPEFKYLIKNVNEYIRAKRKPYLREYASKLVEQYENDGVFPLYETEWEKKFKKPQLEETIIGLYEAQPKLFTSLNLDQKKTFVRFLDLLLDSNERNNLFKIIDEIFELEPEEREDLANLFKASRLSRIIESLKMIEDRYKTYYQLKDLVYKQDLKADEVHHLQKVIENHYWFFGEQYHLLTSAEPKFEEALRRFIFHLTDKDTAPEIDHPHKLKEMDIFACRQNTLSDRIENIVVELKHPLINLGAAQYNQVYNYLELILKQPEFNAPNMYWEFYLIGNKFDNTNFIKNQINTNKPHGICSLMMSLEDGRVKVFAKTWSEIFTEFEIKHKFLDEKLKLEREFLTNELISAREVVESARNNSATQPKEIKIKKFEK
jgi:hypothetical protein